MSAHHQQAMRAAIVIAKQQPSAPFAAVLVESASGKVLAQGVNRAKENPSWHGEIDVINRYAEANYTLPWSELALYTTAEPCPMCMAAIAWAGISQVVYGTDIPTLQQQGWNQISIRADELIAQTPFRTIGLTGGILKTECDALFERTRR